MAGFGSLVPGMAPMPIPQMKSGGMGLQGMNILKAALAAGGGGAAGGIPAGPFGAGVGAGIPAVGESAGPDMPMQVSPPTPPLSPVGAGVAPKTGLLGLPKAGMLQALMAKLQPAMSPATGPIDPNTGMPVTQDVLAGAADMGGPGNALSGLW